MEGKSTEGKEIAGIGEVRSGELQRREEVQDVQMKAVTAALKVPVMEKWLRMNQKDM